MDCMCMNYEFQVNKRVNCLCKSVYFLNVLPHCNIITGSMYIQRECFVYRYISQSNQQRERVTKDFFVLTRQRNNCNLIN